MKRRYRVTSSATVKGNGGVPLSVVVKARAPVDAAWRANTGSKGKITEIRHLPPDDELEGRYDFMAITSKGDAFHIAVEELRWFQGRLFIS